MPTSKDSAQITIPRRLKSRLDEIKGGDTYGDVLKVVLDLVPLERARAELDRRRSEVADRIAYRARPPAPRDASKQLLVAQMAVVRRQAWVSQGKIQEVAPRVTRWILR